MNAFDITDHEFAHFQRFIYTAAGITLPATKKTLVGGRLAKRLQQYRFGSYGEYFRLLTSGQAAQEVQTAVDMDSPEGGSRATRVLLSAHPELTAIAFVNDFMAVGAMREIRQRGLRVPEDISITGFDDIALAQYWYPAVTSVHIPREQIGQRICDALVSGDKETLAREMVIDPELVLRDSTGPAARS